MLPNDPEWTTVFWGNLYNLCQWFNHDRDTGKNATVVARVWREIYDQAKANWHSTIPCGEIMYPFVRNVFSEDCKLYQDVRKWDEDDQFAYTSRELILDLADCALTGPPGPAGPAGPAGADCNCVEDYDDTSTLPDFFEDPQATDARCGVAYKMAGFVFNEWSDALDKIIAEQALMTIVGEIGALLLGGPVGIFFAVAYAAVAAAEVVNTATLKYQMTGTLGADLQDHMMCAFYAGLPADYKLDAASKEMIISLILESTNVNAQDQFLGDFIRGIGAKSLYQYAQKEHYGNYDCTSCVSPDIDTWDWEDGTLQGWLSTDGTPLELNPTYDHFCDVISDTDCAGNYRLAGGGLSNVTNRQFGAYVQLAQATDVDRIVVAKSGLNHPFTIELRDASYSLLWTYSATWVGDDCQSLVQYPNASGVVYISYHATGPHQWTVGLSSVSIADA
jgi:hypothetical protein